MDTQGFPVKEALDKAWILAALTALFVGGYFGVPQLHRGAAGIDLSTPVDRALPYWPIFAYAYALCYAQVFLPALAVPDDRLFRRAALTAAIVMTVAFLFFWVLPVRVAYPPTTGRVGEWILGKNALLQDYGFNAFPSLHVALSVQAALSIHHGRPGWRVPVWISTALIAASTVLIKRHYVLDIPAGALLGWGAHRFFLTGPIRAWRAGVAS